MNGNGSHGTIENNKWKKPGKRNIQNNQIKRKEKVKTNKPRKQKYQKWDPITHQCTLFFSFLLVFSVCLTWLEYEKREKSKMRAISPRPNALAAAAAASGAGVGTTSSNSDDEVTAPLAPSSSSHRFSPSSSSSSSSFRDSLSDCLSTRLGRRLLLIFSSAIILMFFIYQLSIPRSQRSHVEVDLDTQSDLANEDLMEESNSPVEIQSNFKTVDRLGANSTTKNDPIQTINIQIPQQWYGNQQPMSKWRKRHRRNRPDKKYQLVIPPPVTIPEDERIRLEAREQKLKELSDKTVPPPRDEQHQELVKASQSKWEMIHAKWRRNPSGGEGKSNPIIQTVTANTATPTATGSMIYTKPDEYAEIETSEFNESTQTNSQTATGSDYTSSSSSSSSSSYSPPSKRVPSWVFTYNLTSHFHWTWHRTDDYSRSRRDLSLSSLTSLSSSPNFYKATFSLNPLHWIQSHPETGVIVDNFPLIPNPVPHPLPGSTNWNETCELLNIQSWFACRMSPEELSTKLPAVERHVAIGLYKAYVDGGTCNAMVPGTLYNEAVTLVWQKWTNSACWDRPIRRALNVVQYDQLLDTIGVYTGAPGHFGPQQLPRLIRLLAIAPPESKVLVSGGTFASQLIDVCVERGLVTRDRIVVYERHKTYAGRIVYRSETSPFWKQDGHYVHDRTDMEVVNRALARTLDDAARDAIVVIKRTGIRNVANHEQMIELIQKLLPPSLSHLKIEIFTASGHVREHIALFERARLIIAPHGAGLMNVYWSKQGGATHVIELGYNKGMVLPDMYFEMSSHCGHHYWLCRGEGHYAKSITPNMVELEWILKQIYTQLEQRQEQDSARH